MYDAVADPYCYPGTAVLKNLLDIRDQATLDDFEAALTTQRADEPLPAGRLSVAHYAAIHHHLFQDVYAWAGKYRTVRISKDGSAFCYPENIARQMKELFGSLKQKRYLRGLSRERFAADATAFLSTLNAIHPFREGNGRTQTAFLAFLAERAGHPLDLHKLVPEQFLAAMVASFKGDDAPLEKHILLLTT
ncbi:MAG: Fic family protein [Rhizomicrobium sp.]